MKKGKGISIAEPVVVDESDENTEDGDSKNSDFDSINDIFPSLSNDDYESIFNIDFIN